jgi:aminopeptidase N
MDAITAPPAAPPVIRREDYRPPAWLVPQIRLKFTLGLEQTRVQASLDVTRNPAAEPAGVLRLNGDGLTPAGVWVDGAPSSDWQMDGTDLVVPLSGEAHEIGIETLINPAANTQLMGLYASNGMLCTQCEAEGFRRITFFPDRPDVLSVYTVHMSGPKALFPVLLSNGNCTASGTGEDGSHWA